MKKQLKIFKNYRQRVNQDKIIFDTLVNNIEQDHAIPSEDEGEHLITKEDN